MAVKPQKDPRFKPIPGKLRRYQVVATGEVIGRKEFERRSNPATAQASQTGPAIAPTKTPGRQGPIPEPDHSGSTGAGPVPMVEAPAPPPLVTAAYDVTKEAADVAHAAATGMEQLATKIGKGIAQSASYFAEAFVPPHRAYFVPPEACLTQVTEPTARLIARHSHLQVDLGPDGEDIGDLFVGVMACITAISVQKIQYENAKLQYIHDFEVANGPGSYQAALSASRGQGSAGTQKAANQGHADANQNGRGPGANGASPDSGNHYQQYRPGHTITDDLVAGHANGHRGPSNN